MITVLAWPGEVYTSLGFDQVTVLGLVLPPSSSKIAASSAIPHTGAGLLPLRLELMLRSLLKVGHVLV